MTHHVYSAVLISLTHLPTQFPNYSNSFTPMPCLSPSPYWLTPQFGIISSFSPWLKYSLPCSVSGHANCKHPCWVTGAKSFMAPNNCSYKIYQLDYYQCYFPEVHSVFLKYLYKTNPTNQFVTLAQMFFRITHQSLNTSNLVLLYLLFVHLLVYTSITSVHTFMALNNPLILLTTAAPSVVLHKWLGPVLSLLTTLPNSQLVSLLLGL